MAKWNNIIAFAGSTTDNTGSVEFDGDSTITGSLFVTQDITASGAISASGTVVGLNISGTNTGDITLSGTPDYITISNQTITRNQINLTSDVTGQLPSANLGTITSAKISDVDAFSQSGTYASLRAQGTTAADVGLGNVENTALSTYTGNGGALDNQYITNGAGYTTNTGTVDTSGTPANNQLAIFTDLNTIEGDSDLTWDGSTFTINGTGSVDLLQVDDKLQGNGSGFQFFAFNEDTIKVKFANWYSSNDRQYGMGQLWYETWFAAIDNQAGRDNRRIGFYLEEPNSGSSDADGGSGGHPTNSRFYVDINGGYLSGSFEVTGELSADVINGGTF